MVSWQEIDAALAQDSAPPPVTWDEIDAALTEPAQQPEELGSPMYEGGKAFLETLGMAARGALDSGVAKTVTDPLANAGMMPVDYLRRKAVDALPQAEEGDTMAQIAQGAGQFAPEIATGIGVSAAVRAPLLAATEAIPMLGRAALPAARSLEGGISAAATGSPDDPAGRARLFASGLVGGAAGAKAETAKTAFGKGAARVAEAAAYGLGPAGLEGRMPSAPEAGLAALGLAPEVVGVVAKLGNTSRRSFAKALNVKPNELPPPLQSTEGRTKAIEEAKAYVEQPQTEEVIQRGEEVQGRQEEVAPELTQVPEQAVDTSTSTPPTPQRTQPLAPVTAAESGNTLVAPDPPPSIEPAPFDVPSLRPGTKGKGKGGRGEFITEHDDALEAFRTKIRSAGMRPPKNMTNEDFGKAFPPDYISAEGKYTWDQALQEAAELGLIRPDATTDEFRDLFSGKVTRRLQVEPDAQTNVLRIPKQSVREIPNEDMDVGDLVYREGEWHRVINADEDGLTLKDGDETRLGYSQTITGKGIVKPGMEEYNYAMAEYRKQEQANAESAATVEPEPVAPPSRVPDGKGKMVEQPAPVQEPQQAAPERRIPESKWTEIDTDTDLSYRANWMERAASSGGKVSDADLDDILTRAEQIEPEVGSLAWHVAHAVSTNPVASTQTKARALALREHWMRPGRDVPPSPERPSSTSTKNAVREEQRIARGLEPIESKPHAKHEDLIDEGVRRITEKPDLPDEIMAKLRDDGKRAIAVGDEAVMMAEAARVHKEYYDTLDRLGDESLSPSEREVAQGRFEQLEQRLNAIDAAERVAGTEWSQFGRLRQRQIREDYSLEAMTRKVRAAKGRQLTPEEAAKIKEQAAEIQNLQGEIERIRGTEGYKAKSADIEAEIDSIIAEMTTAESTGSLKSAGKKAASAAAEFTEAWKELLGGGRVGITPTAFNEASYKAAKPHFEKAWNEFKGAGKDLHEFIRDTVTKYGRGVKPYLSRFVAEYEPDYKPINIERLKQQAAAEGPVDTKKRGATVTERISTRYGEGDTLEDMRPLVQRLALNFVREGVLGREPLIDKVHEVLKRIDPNATRSQTRALISDYGNFKPLDKEPAKVLLREYKGEMQQIDKIQDMMAGQAPKKTGVERRTPSDDERALIKEVNELKRKGGFTVTDPETQLKTALGAVKTRLRNEITDLDDLIVKQSAAPERIKGVQYDAEATALKAERDAKKREYDAMFPKRPLSNKEVVARAIKSADAAIKRLEADIKQGELYRKRGRKVHSNQLEAKRARLAALREEQKLLRDLDTEVVEMKREFELTEAISNFEKSAPKEKPSTVKNQRVTELEGQLKEMRDKRTRVRSLDASIQKLKDDLSAGRLYSEKKKGKPDTPEMAKKREELNRLRAERDTLRGQDTDAVEARKEQQLLKSIEKAKQDTPTKAKPATVESERVAKLQKELDLLRKGKRESRADELALRSYKARVAHKIADMQERMLKGDFEPKNRGKREVKKDADATTLEFKMNKIKQEFEDMLFQHKLANRTRGERAWDTTQEVVGTIRALKSSIDLSAPGRQGILAMFSHPVTGAKAIGKMFKALRSEKGEFEIMREILQRKNAADYVAADLFLHDPTNPRLSSREEAYRSRWASKIPGVAASERAYTTFLNVLRADMYDALHATLVRKGADTPVAKKMIANYVNVATGRGGGKAFEGKANALSLAFWSPRFVLSRFQYALGQPLWTKLIDNPKAADTLAARKLIAQEYSRTLAGAGLTLTLAASMPGVEVGLDPYSTDFGKIKVGNTRIDILGGVNQAFVLLSRIIGGQKTTQSGKRVKLRGPASQEFGAQDTGGLIGSFLRQKLAPVPQTAMELATGKNAINQPVSPGESLITSPLPLSVDQMIESMRDQGVAQGTIEALIAMTGIGVQTYK